MPLVANSEPIRIVLPSSKDMPAEQQEWVLMDTSALKGGDMVNVESIDNPMELNIELLSGRIKEWGVKESADDEVAMITKDNVARLPVEDLGFLITQLNTGAGSAALPKAPEEI